MVAAARLFFLAFVALPGALVLAESLAWALGTPVLPWIETFTGAWCHRDPTRTLAVGGALLPVCARCTGLYAGLVLGPVLGFFLPRRGRVVATVAGAALLPMVVGLLAAFAEAAGFVDTANATRLALGLMLTTGPAALGILGAQILADALRPSASPTGAEESAPTS